MQQSYPSIGGKRRLNLVDDQDHVGLGLLDELEQHVPQRHPVLGTDRLELEAELQPRRAEVHALEPAQLGQNR